MNERIRKLRRTLDLTQKEFGDRIGVKGNTIATYEAGRNEPIDSVISLICREYNVNEAWLRKGEGEMFAPAPTSALEALAQESGLTRREYIVLEKLLLLRPEVRHELIDCLVGIAAAINSESSSGTERKMTAEELHAELDRQLKTEEIPKAESGAS